MIKFFRTKKICNCTFPTDKNILKKENDYSFCKKCGSIILKSSDGTINYTVKPKQKLMCNPTSPIDIIKSMRLKTQMTYPNLNNLENSTDSMNFYLINRKMILIYLQKFMKMFDYNDIVFYQCLFYMDYVFSHQIKQEISEKEIIYYLIGYFLCATKMKETDSFEPPVEYFVNVKQDTILSIKQIVYYEVLCLKSINYNIFSYSAYDWLIQLIANGIVFNCEIDIKNSIILVNGHRHTIVNSINKCALKMLLNLTLKNIFMKFSPMQIAFGVVQIAREKFLDPNLINNNLYNKLINLYGINFDEYKKCYEEIKSQTKENIIEKEKDEQEEKNNNNNNINQDKLKSKVIKKYSVEDNFVSTIHKMKKQFALNKSSSCKFLFEHDDKKNENPIKLKEIDKNNFNDINNKINEKTTLEIEKISGEKNDKIQNTINLNKILSKKINHLSINYNKKSLRSNDSLPLINTKIKPNIEFIKENKEINMNKSSKVLDIFNTSNSKYSNSKKFNPNQMSSNFSNSTINKNSMNRTLYKISSLTKKNLFKIKSNDSLQENNLEKKVILKVKRNSKFLSIDNTKYEDKKINNNAEHFDRVIGHNTLKYKNLRNRYRTKGNVFSLPNKRNQSSDFIVNEIKEIS